MTSKCKTQCGKNEIYSVKVQNATCTVQYQETSREREKKKNLCSSRLSKQGRVSRYHELMMLYFQQFELLFCFLLVFFVYISVALVILFSTILLFCFLINEASTLIGQAVVVSHLITFMYSCIKIAVQLGEAK